MAEVVYDDEQPKVGPLANPAPTPGGPDIIGRAKAALTAEPPAGQRHGYFQFGPDLGPAVRGVGRAMLPGSLENAAALGASSVIPGAGLLPNLARIGAAGGAAAGTNVAKGGESPVSEGLKASGGAAVGAGLTKGAQALATSGPLKRFTDVAEQKIVDYLKQRVPAWANLNSLKDMFTSQAGYDALHQGYEKSLQSVVKGAAGKPVQLPTDAAKELGIKFNDVNANLTQNARQMLAAAGRPVPDEGMVTVDAADLAKSLIGKSGSDAYRTGVRVLGEHGLDDPAARAAYKTAMGLRESLGRATDKSGGFDVIKAQQATGQTGNANDALLGRGLQSDIAGILNPGGGPLITQGSYKLPGALLGGGLGALGLGHAIPGLGHAGGAAGGAYMGSRIGGMIPKYANVPASPLNPLAQRAVQMSPLSRALIQNLTQESLSS